MAKTKCFVRFLDDLEKQSLKEKTCLFTISVGQQTHEGEHFRATIELLNDTFKECHMLVDDTLQRHTMAISGQMQPDDYYEISKKEGELWLERNKAYYESLHNLKGIIKWDNWLHHEKFNQQRQAILDLISADETYAQAFQTSVNEFVAKLSKRADDNTYLDIDRAKKLSFNFIVEECAALCLWPELKCHYEVYPNLHNAAINMTRERFVLSHNPHVIRPLTLGFRNAAQLKPQRFVYLEEMSA